MAAKLSMVRHPAGLRSRLPRSAALCAWRLQNVVPFLEKTARTALHKQTAPLHRASEIGGWRRADGIAKPHKGALAESEILPRNATHSDPAFANGSHAFNAAMSEAVRPIVLIFTGYYLPGFKAGGILRSVNNLVDHLHKEFQFMIVTRDRDLGDERPYPNIRYDEWCTIHNASVYYLRPKAASLAKLRSIVCSTPHDIVYLTSFFEPLTVKMLVNYKWARADYRPIILAPCGEFARASLRLKYPKKAAFMVFARLARLYAPVIWRASSVFEAEDIRKVMRINPEAIRIASDLPTIDAHAVDTLANPVCAPQCDALRVVFLSRVSPEKNLDFALKVLSKVRSKVIFDIIGPIENPSYWKKCEQLLQELPAHVKARSLGSIKPTEVISTLGQYDLMLFPSGGENYGHVISEALTAGTPVLISNKTPWRNLAARGLGWDLPLNDTASFVRVVDEMGTANEKDRLHRREMVKENMKQFVSESSAVLANRQLFNDARAHRNPVENASNN